MDELHRHRSFTDSGSDPFYGTMAHIAYRKDAGNIGLQQERIAVECPSFRALPVTYKIGTCQQETALVPLDEVRQPICPRQCSDENKHGAGWYALRLAGVGTKHRNLFQMGIAMHF